jgi:hypothetical protein
MHDFLDRTEHAWLGVAASPEVLEPLAVLSAGGTERSAVVGAMRSIARTLERAANEYFEHLEASGVKGRRGRSRLPGLLARVGGLAG